MSHAVKVPKRGRTKEWEKIRPIGKRMLGEEWRWYLGHLDSVLYRYTEVLSDSENTQTKDIHWDVDATRRPRAHHTWANFSAMGSFAIRLDETETHKRSAYLNNWRNVLETLEEDEAVGVATITETIPDDEAALSLVNTTFTRSLPTQECPLKVLQLGGVLLDVNYSLQMIFFVKVHPYDLRELPFLWGVKSRHRAFGKHELM